MIARKVSLRRVPLMAGPAFFDKVSELCRQPNFAWYLSGETIALVGIWAQKIAIGWLTWELTKSNFWLGAIAFADLFPTVVITPIAGVIADRVNRLNMARLCQALAGLHAFLMAALIYFDLINIWSLFALTFVLGVVLAFATAARLAVRVRIALGCAALAARVRRRLQVAQYRMAYNVLLGFLGFIFR